MDYYNVTVAGAGGMGFHLALGLAAMPRSPRYRVFVIDDDVIDEGGGSRLCVPEEYFGLLKIEALELLDSRIEAIRGKVPPIPVRSVAVIDATDLPSEGRKGIKAAAEAAGSLYIRASYDVTNGDLVLSVSTGVGFGRRGGYTDIVLRPHAMAAGGLAAIIIDKYLNRKIELPFIFRFPFDSRIEEGEHV